jgi:16S rRNA (cytosine1402-N4)-methyltransferase
MESSLSLSIFLNQKKNIIVDCTLWFAGHAIGILQKLTKWDIFIGIDCDQDNLQCATNRILEHLQNIPKKQQPTVYCIDANFRNLKDVLWNIGKYQPINALSPFNKWNIDGLTAVYADLGVSSAHFDTSERGFSFRLDGPLDMRLNTEQEVDAKKLINSLPYEKLAEIFRVYWDEPKAGYITKKILEKT